MVGTFGEKPSRSHVVWNNREDGDGKKRFDFEFLEKWADRYAVEYETRVRVDHDRGSEPREQHLVVFSWTETPAETFELGDDSWQFGGTKTPGSFVEIDDRGEARIKRGSREAVFDVRELWLDGAEIYIDTAGHGRQTMNSRKLVERGKSEDR